MKGTLHQTLASLNSISRHVSYRFLNKLTYIFSLLLRKVFSGLL